MKKIVCMLLASVMVMALTSCQTGKAVKDTGVTINVYNWGEYISDGADGSLDVIKDFEEKTGIKVVYNTFENNEAMYSKLKAGGVSYDVIIPSDYMIGKMIEEKMLLELDYSNIPNASLIDSRFKGEQYNTYDAGNKYSVPYTWGRVGIVYNKQKVKEPVDSWDILWDEKYKGQVLMFDNARDAFGIAQFKLGQSINTTDKNELKIAAEELKKQKPVVQNYVMDQVFRSMPSGNAWIAPYYLGDCLTIYDDEGSGNMGIAVPKEGTNLFVDAMCIPSGAQHKKEAEAFINYMCSTEAAYANIEYISYSSPQTEAAKKHKEYLQEEYDDQIASLIYPEDWGKSVMFKTLPTDTYQVMNDLWVSVRSGTK